MHSSLLHADGMLYCTATLHPAHFSRLASLIQTLVGIHMSPDKRTMMEGRLAPRLRELKLNSFGEYCNLLARNTPEGLSEQQNFVDAITTHKTDFFREREHFVYLAEHALPELKRIHAFTQEAPLHVWSAACSSGEEAYSIAMTIDDGASYDITGSFQVLATDVALDCVNKGKTAIYNTEDIEPVPLPLRQKYLLKSRDPKRHAIRIAKELRTRVEFKRLNLMSAHYDVPMQHIIFLRNVLIYFERRIQCTVLQKLAQRLLPGGYLFVSHTENVQGLDIPLEVIAPSILRRIVQ